MNIKIDKKRYEWVDILKFMGILYIYIGHFGANAGKLYTFVYIFHVPLFFFIAGFFAQKGLDLTPRRYLIKKAKTLLFPYFIFSLISVISFSLADDLSIRESYKMSIQFLYGIRNTLASGSLWFLPCMFMVSIIYYTLKKIFLNQKSILFASCIIFVATQTILPNNPIENPSWIMNVDSAMYYLFFYSLGSVVFDKIISFNFNSLKIAHKVTYIVTSVLFLCITVITYFKGTWYIYNFISDNFFSLNSLYLVESIYSVILSCIIIYVNILIAFLLKDIHLFKELGANTLILCGIENVVKLYCHTILTLIGLSLNTYTPLACVIYAFILLIIANWIGNNVINKYLRSYN